LVLSSLAQLPGSHRALAGRETPGFNSFHPEKPGRSRQTLALDDLSGEGIVAPPATARQGPSTRKSLGVHQGRGSCLLQRGDQCIIPCWAPQLSFYPLSDGKMHESAGSRDKTHGLGQAANFRGNQLW